MTIAQAERFYGQDTKDYEIEKNKDFLIWLKTSIKDGYHCFIETEELQELIDNGDPIDEVIAIGPVPMMKAVVGVTKPHNLKTMVSLNPIMIDGTGMCGACRLQVGDEIKFACVDGPEFDGHKVDFDQAMKRQQTYKTEEGRAMLAALEGETHHGGCGSCN